MIAQSTDPASAPPPPSPALARVAGAIVRTFESFGLHGAPTVLKLLSKVPALGRVQAVARLGSRWITFPAFDAYWSRYLWTGVAFEKDVEQIFRRLGSGAVLIDCGANIGYWSVRAAEFGFKQVIAVEANINLIPMLRENFRLNAVKGEILHAAIYSTSGDQLFLDKTHAHAEGTLGTNGLPVTSVTLIDIARTLPPGELIVAKLDVEGAEIEALDGAAGVEGIIFVYEDFPKQEMRVTRALLKRKMVVFGVSASGRHCRINSPEAAHAFNSKSTLHGPSNLLACAPNQAAMVRRLLSEIAPDNSSEFTYG